MTEAAASQRFRAIGATVADLAHNFNNLLTTVTAVADAALARPSIVLASGYAEDGSLAVLNRVAGRYLRKPFGASECLTSSPT